MTQKQAGSFAAERLESIEQWGKRTFYASIVTAVSAVVVAVVVGYAGVQYLRLRAAVLETSAEVERRFGEIRTSKPAGAALSPFGRIGK